MSRYWAWCLCAALAAAGAAGAAAAVGESAGKGSDWPQWRGPHRDGLSPETGLLQEWPKGGPPLLWKANNLGSAYSSVAVVGDRIYTLGDRGKSQLVLALDGARKGKEVWARRLGPPWPDGGARSTPTVDGDRLYALGTDGDLVCLETATGKVRWRKNLRRDFGGRMMSGWRWSESLLVDGDKVICTPGADRAALVALDKLTGKVLWRSAVKDAGGAGYASAVVTEVGGVRLYVQWLGRCVVGVAARTGKLLWRNSSVRNGTANIPTPIVRGNLVFCSTGYDAGSVLLRLTANGKGGVSAREVYHLAGDEVQVHHGGMVLVGDYLYCGHGHNNGLPTCLALKTGRLAWGPVRGPGSGSAAVIYADGNLYCRYQNGVMALIRATPKGYRLRGTFRLPRDTGTPSWQHPAIAGGKLYLRGADTLLCYDIRQH
jgi:outer membrane protein assembly factor BamB